MSANPDLTVYLVDAKQLAEIGRALTIGIAYADVLRREGHNPLIPPDDDLALMKKAWNDLIDLENKTDCP